MTRLLHWMFLGLVGAFIISTEIGPIIAYFAIVIVASIEVGLYLKKLGDPNE